MALLKSNTIVYGTANIQGNLVVGSVFSNTAVSNTTGSLIVVGGAGISGNLYTGNIVLAAANSITFGDGTVQTTAGGGSAAGSYANSAFAVANSAAIYANGAFTKANSSFTVANAALPLTGGTLTGTVNLLQNANNAGPVCYTAVNANNGTLASADYTVANDLYASQTVYGDFGINSSRFSPVTPGDPLGDANGTYIYCAGGSFTAGTGGAFDTRIISSDTIRIIVGATGNVQMIANLPATSNTTGTLRVTNGVGITGNLYTGSIFITGPTSNGITFADGTKMTTAATGSGGSTSFGSIITTVQGWNLP